MASKIMHMAIHSEICKNHSLIIQDTGAFMAASIAPDLYNADKKQKSQTHFFTDREDGSHFIDLKRFQKKYHTELKTDSFALGYYIHLLSDDLWLRTMFYEYIRRHPKEDQAGLLKKYYHDFYILNSVLADYYQLDTEIPPQKSCAVEEVAAEDLNNDLLHIRDDFREVKDLHLFDLKDITEYINLCVFLGTDVIRQMKSESVQAC